MSLDETQIDQYLARLDIDNPKKPSKEFLDELIYAHHTHIPFETIGIHRGEKTPDLSIEALYDKVITNRLGGYCFELNRLFNELLIALGFDAKPVLCRAVRGRDGRMPINHRGILVDLPEGRYFADVGFGGPMPAGAMLLENNVEQNIFGDTYIAKQCEDSSWWKIDRITKAASDLHDDALPARRQTELELCTSTVEDQDFEALNVFFSNPGTLFRDHEIANLRTPEGYLGFKDGILTIRENGNKQTIEFENDDEAASALRQYFSLEY